MMKNTLCSIYNNHMYKVNFYKYYLCIRINIVHSSVNQFVHSLCEVQLTPC